MLVHVIKSILSRNALGLHPLIPIRIILILSNAAKSFHFARSNIVRSFTSWWNLFHQQHKFYETRGFCVVNVLSTSEKFSNERNLGHWKAWAETIVQEHPYLSHATKPESCSLHKQDHQFSTGNWRMIICRSAGRDGFCISRRSSAVNTWLIRHRGQMPCSPFERPDATAPGKYHYVNITPFVPVFLAFSFFAFINPNIPDRQVVLIIPDL